MRTWRCRKSRRAAVQVDPCAVNVARLVREQEGGGMAEILRRAEAVRPAGRGPLLVLPLPMLLLGEAVVGHLLLVARLVLLVDQEARQQRVDAHIVAAE